MRTRFGVVAAMAALMNALAVLPVFAESRPIEQLPGDVVRWSTVWMAIPTEIAKETREHGPVAGFMWGPAKGTAIMLNSTSREIWKASTAPDRPSIAPKRSNPKGPIFRYDF